MQMILPCGMPACAHFTDDEAPCPAAPCAGFRQRVYRDCQPCAMLFDPLLVTHHKHTHDSRLYSLHAGAFLTSSSWQWQASALTAPPSSARVDLALDHVRIAVEQSAIYLDASYPAADLKETVRLVLDRKWRPAVDTLLAVHQCALTGQANTSALSQDKALRGQKDKTLWCDVTIHTI